MLTTILTLIILWIFIKVGITIISAIFKGIGGILCFVINVGLK